MAFLGIEFQTDKRDFSLEGIAGVSQDADARGLVEFHLADVFFVHFGLDNDLGQINDVKQLLVRLDRFAEGNIAVVDHAVDYRLNGDYRRRIADLA